MTGNVAKRFLKYTAAKRRSLKNRRALFQSKKIFKKKKPVSKGPDEHYGLAEPLYCMSDDEFEVKKTEFISSITLSEDSKKKLELETRNQSNNQKWFVERRKRLTASNFGKICKMRPYTSCKISVHDIIYGSVTTHATEYGKITEQIAVQALQEKINKTIKKCGLFIDRTIPYLAATPG